MDIKLAYTYYSKMRTKISYQHIQLYVVFYCLLNNSHHIRFNGKISNYSDDITSSFTRLTSFLPQRASLDPRDAKWMAVALPIPELAPTYKTTTT